MLMQTLTNILHKKFIGTDDLRKNLTSVLSDLSKTGSEIIVTQHGKPQAILVDLNAYLEQQETLEDLSTPGFIESIHKGVQEVRAGKGITLEQLKKDLNF